MLVSPGFTPTTTKIPFVSRIRYFASKVVLATVFLTQQWCNSEQFILKLQALFKNQIWIIKFKSFEYQQALLGLKFYYNHYASRDNWCWTMLLDISQVCWYCWFLANFYVRFSKLLVLNAVAIFVLTNCYKQCFRVGPKSFWALLPLLFVNIFIDVTISH